MSGRKRLPRTACAHCGQQRRCTRAVLDQLVCAVCELRFLRDPKTCPGCGVVKVLAFYDDQHRPACAGCTGNEAIYACDDCGREDSPFGRRCAICVLTERTTALLSQPGAGIHPRLQPLFDTLLAGGRPMTTLYWFNRSSGPGILQSMARGEIEISHAAFEAMPANRTVNYLRDLLVAVGVLPAYNAELARVVPWLEARLAAMPKDHAETLGRYAKWQVLHRLRLQDARGLATHGAINGARASIVATGRFLAWLADQDATLSTATQADLDRFVAEHPGRSRAVVSFLVWAEQSGLSTELKIPAKQQGTPQVTLSEQERWADIELLLHDDSIRLYSRVAGLFTLLFAQPLARTCRMRADQVSQHPDGSVTVRFDTFPIELPAPLDALVLEHLARRGQASYASRPDHWLFPGGIPGKHLATENIRGQLVQRSIQPGTARKAAMFQLASQIPTPILAEILGLAPKTAVRWAALAARDWGPYIALRQDPPIRCATTVTTTKIGATGRGQNRSS